MSDLPDVDGLITLASHRTVRRHGFPPGLVANIAGLATLIARAASQEA